MLRLSTLCMAPLPLLLLSACEEKTTVIGPATDSECALTPDSLDGTTWVLAKLMPDQSTLDDQSTRLKMIQDGDQLKAKYNVSSREHMYGYTCQKQTKRITCMQDVDGDRLSAFCEALIAGGASCDEESLANLLPDVDKQLFADVIKTSNAKAEELKKKPEEWARFVQRNNTLGNKLRGILYIRIDQNKCRLKVNDMYMTVYEGKKVEDSNPVGMNAFNRYDDPLFWEDCTDNAHLVAVKEAELPKPPIKAEKDVATVRDWAVGDEVHFHYKGAADRKAPREECSYTYDMWLDWKPLAQGVEAAVVDGAIQWHHSHSFDKAGVYVTDMVRYKDCGGSKETLGVSCNLIKVQ